MDWEHYRNHYVYQLFKVGQGVEKDAEKMTPIEKTMNYVLAFCALEYGLKNFHIFPQMKLSEYKVDFLVSYSMTGSSSDPLTNIIIECDGHDFHEKTKQQAAHDKKRDRFFTTRGYIVLRYTGSEIYNDPWKVRDDLKELLIPAKKVEKNDRSVSNE